MTSKVYKAVIGRSLGYQDAWGNTYPLPITQAENPLQAYQAIKKEWNGDDQ